MQLDAGTSEPLELVGVLRFSPIEGGIWSIELDASHVGLGDHVVLQGWAPPAGIDEDSRVRARVRESQAQFGFLMAGPMVDVLEIAPA